MIQCLANFTGTASYTCNKLTFLSYENAICERTTPRAVVYPKSAVEVAQVLQYATRYGITVSVRGGGHSYTCNSVIQDSIQILTRNLRSIVVNRSDRTVTLGAGVLSNEIFEYLPRSKYSIPHGGCGSVGYVGFCIHGGIHAPVTRITGLCNESIESMNVVLANGTIAALSRTSASSSLWDAMRVAGSSFGVVTSLTIRYLHEPEATVFGVIVVLSVDAFVKAHLAFIEQTRRDGKRAPVTLDGAGPGRFLPVLSDQLRLDTYILEVSVRQDSWIQTRETQRLRAYAYLLTHLPPLTPLTFLPQIDDISFAYDLHNKPFVSTFTCFDVGCENLPLIIRSLTSHYRKYEYIDSTEWCWQVISTTTTFDDKVCYEYNCPDYSVFAQDLILLEEQFKTMCPGNVKYYNVPSFWSTPREFFTNYDALTLLKSTVDPQGLFREVGGVGLLN